MLILHVKVLHFTSYRQREKDHLLTLCTRMWPNPPAAKVNFYSHFPTTSDQVPSLFRYRMYSAEILEAKTKIVSRLTFNLISRLLLISWFSYAY